MISPRLAPSSVQAFISLLRLSGSSSACDTVHQPSVFAHSVGSVPTSHTECLEHQHSSRFSRAEDFVFSAPDGRGAISDQPTVASKGLSSVPDFLCQTMGGA